MAEDGETRPLFTPPPECSQESLPEYGINSNEDEVVTYQPPKRSKTGARVYYTVVLLWVFLLLLLAGISLGSFGLRQSKITNFYRNHSGSHGHCCILYVNFGYVNGSKTYLHFPSNFGLCTFVFWGLASLNIVASSFIIYLVVLIVLGPKVLSGLRILELFVSFVTVLGAFVLSVTITAGISKTCGAILKGISNDCSRSHLIRESDPNTKMNFYEEIIVAQNSCWVATLFWFAFSIWKLVLVVIYTKQRKNMKNKRVIEDKSFIN